MKSALPIGFTAILVTMLLLDHGVAQQDREVAEDWDLPVTDTTCTSALGRALTARHETGQRMLSVPGYCANVWWQRYL